MFQQCTAAGLSFGLWALFLPGLWYLLRNWIWRSFRLGSHSSSCPSWLLGAPARWKAGKSFISVELWLPLAGFRKAQLCALFCARVDFWTGVKLLLWWCCRFGGYSCFQSHQKYRTPAEMVTFRELVWFRLEQVLIILRVSAKQRWSSGNLLDSDFLIKLSLC